MERTFSPMVRQFSAIAGLQQAYTLVYSLDPDGESGCRLTLCRTGSSQRMDSKYMAVAPEFGYRVLQYLCENGVQRRSGRTWWQSWMRHSRPNRKAARGVDNERTADVLQVALASYDRKELRVQKNYLEEQNPVLACTCFLNGHKLLQELQQGHNFDIVVLCSQMEDMSSIEFMMELRKLEHKPLLMLFDEGRRKNSSALRMEDSGSCCCVERMELKNLLRELYRMPGQQWQRTEQQCQQLYHSWGIRIPDINCSYLTSAVGVVYGTSQKLAIRKEILQAVSEQYGVSVSAVDSGIRRMIDQLEAKPAEGWTQFKAESGFEAEKPTTGKLIYAIKRYLIQQKSRE